MQVIVSLSTQYEHETILNDESFLASFYIQQHRANAVFLGTRVNKETVATDKTPNKASKIQRTRSENSQDRSDAAMSGTRHDGA